MSGLFLYLRIDYDDLPAEGKVNKARELAVYLNRHDLLSNLVKVGKQLRPDIPWIDVLKTNEGDKERL